MTETSGFHFPGMPPEEAYSAELQMRLIENGITESIEQTVDEVDAYMTEEDKKELVEKLTITHMAAYVSGYFDSKTDPPEKELLNFSS